MGKINSLVGFYITENLVNQPIMAKALGVSKQAVGHWCNGQRYPNKWIMPMVLAYLGRYKNRMLLEIEVFPDGNTQKSIDTK